MPDYTQDTIALLNAALKSSLSKAKLAELLFKDANSTFTQSSSAITGITAYDLQAPAISLVPVITPLRNETPRAGGGAGIQANWRAITAINPTGIRPGVTPGNRNAVMQITQKAFTAAFKGLGTEVRTDFEAEWAAMGFDDPRGLATLDGLRNLMIQEEQTILGGNGDQPLNGGAATPTPNLVDSGTGGTLLHAQAYFVICAALTVDGFQYGSVAGGVQGAITRTNSGGTTDSFGGGTGKVSAEATITTGGGADTHSITASLTAPILGAAAYAWFLSTTSGNERLVAITNAPTVVLTALPTGTNQLASSLGTNDNSTNQTVFDGLIYLAATAGSGAYTAAISSTLTGDNAGGVVQIDAALKSMWDNFRLGPEEMWLNSQQEQDIGVKILTGSSTAAQRFIFATDAAKIAGGIATATYRNKFSMNGAQDIKLRLHPNMPPGMILMTSKTIPYPLNEIPGQAYRVRTRKEYNQIDWPIINRMWESGVYVDEVLQHFAPFSMALLYDVRPG
jgi:hypothetical protein